MATLQKFKLLATQCAVARSPRRSPSTSPVIHLRRRKTLRMLLSRTGGNGGGGRRLPRGDELLDQRDNMAVASPEKSKALVVSHKLKDFLLSSPPPLEKKASERVRGIGEGRLPASAFARGGGVSGLRVGQRSFRPLTATFRQRLLLRRAWRPVLCTIPESP
ncbi:hypothetical protein NMG60_11006166 [Bertholletia excelsa]